VLLDRILQPFLVSCIGRGKARLKLRTSPFAATPAATARADVAMGPAPSARPPRSLRQPGGSAP